MSFKHDDDQVETIARRRFNYIQICEQANQQLRNNFTSAQATEPNLRVRRKLYGGNLERTRAPGDEESAYIEYLEGMCEQLKDILKLLPIHVVFYSYMHLPPAALGLMGVISMGPLPENLRRRIRRRAIELRYLSPVLLEHVQFLCLTS
jgi:hypothetical protein